MSNPITPTPEPKPIQIEDNLKAKLQNISSRLRGGIDEATRLTLLAEQKELKRQLTQHQANLPEQGTLDHLGPSQGSKNMRRSPGDIVTAREPEEAGSPA